jgi:Methyltransferase domain
MASTSICIGDQLQNINIRDRPFQVRPPLLSNSYASFVKPTSLHEQLGLRREQSIELLKALHIVTREGKINQDSRRKLKQVNHLLQFIEPLLNATLAERGKVDVVDHGAGKSYLGFMLYDRYLRSIDKPRHVYGIETREDLVLRARELAREAKFDAMSFLSVSAADAAQSSALPETVDIVTALHACDTATDDSISFAIAKKAKYVVLVPCCQAEIAAHFRDQKGRTLATNSLMELWRHPIQAREFGAQMTNVLRGLRLEAHGYKVTVTELVGWEHSMKNELIIAEFKNLPRARGETRLADMLTTFGLVELKTRFA